MRVVVEEVRAQATDDRRLGKQRLWETNKMAVKNWQAGNRGSRRGRRKVASTVGFQRCTLSSRSVGMMWILILESMEAKLISPFTDLPHVTVEAMKATFR